MAEGGGKGEGDRRIIGGGGMTYGMAGVMAKAGGGKKKKKWRVMAKNWQQFSRQRHAGHAKTWRAAAWQQRIAALVAAAAASQIGGVRRRRQRHEGNNISIMASWRNQTKRDNNGEEACEQYHGITQAAMAWRSVWHKWRKHGMWRQTMAKATNMAAARVAAADEGQRGMAWRSGKAWIA